jgi:hypothetical protein
MVDGSSPSRLIREKAPIVRGFLLLQGDRRRSRGGGYRDLTPSLSKTARKPKNPLEGYLLAIAD